MDCFWSEIKGGGGLMSKIVFKHGTIEKIFCPFLWKEYAEKLQHVLTTTRDIENIALQRHILMGVSQFC